MKGTPSNAAVEGDRFTALATSTMLNAQAGQRSIHPTGGNGSRWCSARPAVPFPAECRARACVIALPVRRALQVLGEPTGAQSGPRKILESRFWEMSQVRTKS